MTARPSDPRLYPARAASEAVAIYLVDNGFHTEVVLPAAVLADGAGPAWRAARVLPPSPWISLGWGDARFFIEEDLSIRRVVDGLRALFRPGNPSVVRIEGLRDSPDRLYAPAAVMRLRVSRLGLQRLVARVDHSLALDEAGRPVLSPLQLAPGERFFRSRETFNLIHLCNHWTAELLTAAGLATTPMLDLFPASLRLDLKLRDGVSGL